MTEGLGAVVTKRDARYLPRRGVAQPWDIGGGLSLAAPVVPAVGVGALTCPASSQRCRMLFLVTENGTRSGPALRSGAAQSGL